jgi:hypothetical protein
LNVIDVMLERGGRDLVRVTGWELGLTLREGECVRAEGPSGKKAEIVRL